MKLTVYQHIINQWSMVPAVEIADLSGKIVVVVGANAGIGFEAAKHFARMNPAKLILACRSESKGKAAVTEIQAVTGFKRCEVLNLDLTDFASVKRFAERFDQEYDRLDILVMNAGVGLKTHVETVNGWETSIQVNHLATAFTSLLLLPRLIDTGKTFGTTSRIVLVSSGAHYLATLPHDVQQSSRPLHALNSAPMEQRYHRTKLLNVFFVRALQERLNSTTPLTVNAVNPGHCASELSRNTTRTLMSDLERMLLARTPEQGSRQVVYAAVGGRDNEAAMKGAYIDKAAPTVIEPSDFVISAEGKKMQDNFWRETVDILTKEAPELKSIVTEYLI